MNKPSELSKFFTMCYVAGGILAVLGMVGSLFSLFLDKFSFMVQFNHQPGFGYLQGAGFAGSFFLVVGAVKFLTEVKSIERFVDDLDEMLK